MNQWMTAWTGLLPRSIKKKIYYIQAYEPLFYVSGLIVAYKYLAWLTYFFPFFQIVNSPTYLGYKNIKSKNCVPPGIDMALFFRKTFSDRKEIVIGTIARNEPWKGTDNVAIALKNVLTRRENIRVCIADFGDNNYGNEFSYTIPKNDAELAEYYRGLDILVACPTEQFGAYHYPILEAMSVGTLVVCTPFAKAVDKITAFVIDECTPNKIEDAIIGLLDMPINEQNKIRERAYNEIQELSWEKISERLLNFFERA